uniref:Meiotic double-stranded break formation protein 4 n=1 Tax=Leptobrachium leishanense TaxID=445787 RepID=A0A8C5R7V0_9ANUR
MDTQFWYQMSAKLALAVAIVRSKPEGKTSQEYTMHLANLVSAQDSTWKTKVEALESEVLHLRQQILLSKIHSCSHFEKENTALITEPCEHLGEQMSQLNDDSGCDIFSQDIVKASNSSQVTSTCEQPCTSLSYFASPSINLPITDFSLNSEKQLSDQMQFLNHFLALRKLTPVRHFTKLENECSVIEESVSGLLNGLLSLYKKPMPSVTTYQTEAIRTIIRLLTDSCLSMHTIEKCIEKLEDFSKSLINTILTGNTINRFQIQQSMTNCLISVGEYMKIRGPLINLLCSETKRFVDELLVHQQNSTKYDIAKYENMFSLFSVLENLLQRINERHETSKLELFQETKLFLQNIDQTILCIADEFPLFCLYLWRLGTLYSYI